MAMSHNLQTVINILHTRGFYTQVKDTKLDIRKDSIDSVGRSIHADTSLSLMAIDKAYAPRLLVFEVVSDLERKLGLLK